MKGWITMLKVNSTKMKQAMIVAALITGATWGLQMPSDAANLMVTIPSNYSKSIMGSITGSRVTTTVDGTPHSVRTENLNGDPGVFNFNLNGQSKIFLRQYTYSDTNLKPNEVLDVNGDWNTASASGKLTTTVNPHGVTAKGNTLYATGYDKGVVTVATISGNALTEDKTKAISLLQAAKDTGESSTSEYTSAASAHGEGIIVRGNDLYVQASVNKQGGYYNYDDGFLFHYTINSDGSLSHKANDFVRIGKNTDQSRINLYNDHIFVSAIGGDQKYGEGNTESSITAASLNNGAFKQGKWSYYFYA